MAAPLTLPCLRGAFGDWIYYDCLFSLREIAARVTFAKELQDSPALSELIQRELTGKRAVKIAHYLNTNSERFFNSLVLATYEGSPQWFEIGNLQSGKNALILKEMPQGAIDALGLLRLDGSERIFALDGQHRLAGIKRALRENPALGDELMPVILVGHASTADGTRRTRRLFTTLNKTAVPVKKMERIALDEDDVMAITVRRMVEQDAGFKDPKIAVISSESMPASNDTALLSIAGLYDQLLALFRFEARRENPKSTDDDLRFNRPADDVLDAYHTLALDYFNAVGAAFPPVKTFLASKDSKPSVAANRTAAGGHVLFRTIGLDIFTQAALALAKRDKIDLTKAVAKLAVLPTQLDQAPYRGVIWDPVRKTMKPANKALGRRLIFHTLSLPMSARQRDTLLGDYRVALGFERDDATIALPAKLG